MKFIIKNGLSSKYTPEDTLDAIKLATYTSYIDGVLLNLNMSKDGEIIVYRYDSYLNHPKHSIADLTTTDLAKYNLGSKVQKHNFITLKQVLDVFSNTTKLLVLNVENLGQNNTVLIEKVKELVSEYPNDNVYIQSANKELVLLAKEKLTSIRSGARITTPDKYFWNLNLDFYTVCMNSLPLTSCQQDMMKKMNNHIYIMLDGISSKEDMNEAKEVLKEQMEDIFIVTSNLVKIMEEDS